MSDRPVILFMFAGRRQNMRVNLPQLQRILDENPRVQLHIWNLARDNDDAKYLSQLPQTLKGWPSAKRAEVVNEFAGPRAFRCLNKVWDYYANPRFQNCLFVKIDDDVVFIDTGKFAEFVDHVEANPDRILTAEVVNNGACTPFMPELWQGFLGLDIPLLDVHESNEYAQLAHRFFFDNWRDLIARPTGLAESETWLSINFIGLHWDMLRSVNARIGRRSPEWIADRQWRAGSRIGDEGAANIFPRSVMTGFTVAHLGFGPQKLTEYQESEWCQDYDEVAWEFLQSGATEAAQQ